MRTPAVGGQRFGADIDNVGVVGIDGHFLAVAAIGIIRVVGGLSKIG
jgi:hypothetical protein